MIDKCVCLCLDKRVEMWTDLSIQVEKNLGMIMEKFICGSGTGNFIYNHIDEEVTKEAEFYYVLNKCSYNAFLCHKKIIQQCIDQKLNNILLLEDDAYFTSRFPFIWNNIKNLIKINTNWDIIYLGWWCRRNDEDSEDRNDLEYNWTMQGVYGIDSVPMDVKYKVSGLHGVLINKSLFRPIVNAQMGPLDSVIGHAFDKINALYIYPKIIHTKKNWSYCENYFQNRSVL